MNQTTYPGQIGTSMRSLSGEELKQHLLRTCSFAFPGTYGHECGKPATHVAVRRSGLTKSGVYYTRRCPECMKERGGENAGLREFVPFNPELHRNEWK